jgi:ATP-dependent RNA helicase RhlE
MLQMLSQGSGRNHDPRALIVTPTRELAAQVHDMVRTYGKHLKLRSAVVFGGVGINPQIGRLRRGVDILVATPGRLLDHVGQKTVDLSRVEILVLDEADRMLDMGFIPDIRKILKLLRQKRQNLMFSATYATDVQQLARSLLSNPERIQVAPQNVATDLVTHKAYPVVRSRKQALLLHLLKTENLQQALVFTRTRHGADRLAKQLTKRGIFTRTRHGADRLAKQLTKRGINATSIHGAKSQSARTRALADFKRGTVKLLVATDLAARGLDIIKLYVHRIGRSGRAGSNGVAITLVCRDEGQLLSDIEEVLRQRIPIEVIEGFNQEPNQRPQVNGRPTSPNQRPARPAPRGRAGRRPDRRRQSAAR